MFGEPPKDQSTKDQNKRNKVNSIFARGLVRPRDDFLLSSIRDEFMHRQIIGV